jgi:hypothetical protein
MTDRAACCGTKFAMMAGHVAGNGADGCSLDATLRIRRNR